MVQTIGSTWVPAVLLTALAIPADAHQRIMTPSPTYTIADKDRNWAPIAFMEGQYKTGPDLLGFIKSKGAKTLRDFMDNKSLYKIINNPAASFECGWTNPNGPRQTIPANGMIRSTGYTHEGPCEVWLDDVRVLHGDNCNQQIGANKPSYKIDWSSCKGECMLRWYWFGNRFVKNAYSWQVYKACIPMKGASGATRSREFNATDDAQEVYGFQLLADDNSGVREGEDSERDSVRASYGDPTEGPEDEPYHTVDVSSLTGN